MPSFSAVVTVEKQTPAHFSVVSLPSGSMTAQYGNTRTVPSVKRRVVQAPGFARRVARQSSAVE